MSSLLTQISIGKRLAASFALFLLFLIAGLAIGIKGMAALSDANKKMVEQEFNDFVKASESQKHAEEAALNLLLVLSTPDQESRIPLYKNIDTHNKRIDALFEQTFKDSMTGEDYGDLKNAREVYQVALIETVELVEYDADEALAHFTSTTRPALDRFLESMNMLVSLKQKRLIEEHQSAASASERIQRLTLILGVVTIFIGIVLAVWVAKSITAPINRAVTVAKQIANGVLG